MKMAMFFLWSTVILGWKTHSLFYLESAKLRATCALVPNVPRALVSHVLRVLPTFIPYVTRALRILVSYVPCAQRALVSHVPRALGTFVQYLPSCLMYLIP